MFLSVSLLGLAIFVASVAQFAKRAARGYERADTSARIQTPPREGTMLLPDDVLEDISRRLTLVDALAWRCTCRTATRAVGEACEARMKTQYDTVIRHFPVHVLRSLPMAVWYQVEWIDCDPKWLGNTGYIDNVEPIELPGGPFKCCYDPHGRLALLLRRRKDIAVLFQRYTDHTSTWAFASKTLPIGGCRLSESMVARLALWLSHEYADFRPT